MDVRVRFAPSPTGYLHIGGARTALFNWIFARQHGGRFILRIDDTDEQRSTEASTRQILDSLRWLGLHWDEGPEVGGPHAPYVQSERRAIYVDYVRQLLETNHAYRCYCTREELAAERARAEAEKRPLQYSGRCRHLSQAERERFEREGRPFVVRMKIESGSVEVADLILGKVTFDAETIDDFIIVKSNGSPLYNFTSPIDDVVMGITHVIRGADHLSNTPKQVLISRALGMEPPRFAHVPLVLDERRRPFSKRLHGDLVAVDTYRRQGYLPEALINYIVRLGWSYDDKQEIFSVSELIEKFDFSRVRRSAAVFDMKKLQWLNQQYILKLSIPERTDAVIPYWQRARLVAEPIPPQRRAWLEKVVEAVGDRLVTLEDIIPQTAYLLQADDVYEYDPKAVKKFLQKEGIPEALAQMKTLLAATTPFDAETVEMTIREFVERTGVKIWQPIRVAVTGQSRGPGLYEILELLGRESTLTRFDRTLAMLQASAQDTEGRHQ